MGGEGSEEDRDRARRNESERREGKKKTREKTIIQKESCTTMFTVALFTIARTWKQPDRKSVV